MKISFSLLPEDIRHNHKEIKGLVGRLFPDAKVEFDKNRGRLNLTLSEGNDREAVADAICQGLSDMGILAQALPEHTVYSAMPPIRTDLKPKRQVPLSVFITSLIALALAVFVVTFTLAGGFADLMTEDTLGTGVQEGESYADKISLIDSIFEAYSLYETDGQKLLDMMLKAYAYATDDKYAYYYNAEEYNALMSDNSGNAVGIGVMVTQDPGSPNLLIVRVLPDSPAAKAGVQAGDVITHLGKGEERVSVAEIGAVEANNRMAGAADTAAEFTVLRDGVEHDFSIVRAAIKTVSVESRVSETDPTVGIVKIFEFNIETPAQFKAAMASLREKGCTKMIFDVRDNPGGDLNSISAVLSYFLEDGQTILSTVEKDGTTTTYKVEAITFEGEYAPCSVAQEEIGMYRSFVGSMAVLTSDYTASAAELFTAALKDYQLARIVGDTTYGKGIIQSIIPLDYWGYEGALKLTVGYYNPPISGNYDGVGIKPDVEVSLGENADSVIIELLPENEDPQLQAAIAELNVN